MKNKLKQIKVKLSLNIYWFMYHHYKLIRRFHVIPEFEKWCYWNDRLEQYNKKGEC